MRFAGLPEGAQVLDAPATEAPQYAGLPQGAQVFAGLPEGAKVLQGPAQKSMPLPPPTAETRPPPELRQAPPEWKTTLHNFVYELMPWTGMGLGGAAGAAAGAALGPAGAATAGVAGAGTGYAAGKKAAGLVDTAVGYPDLHPPQSGAQAAMDTAGDILTGAAYEAGGRLAFGVGEKAVKGATRLLSELGPRGVNQQAVDKTVQEALQGIRPPVEGRRTWGQRVKGVKRAGEAVQTIIANKNQLAFPAADGTIERGRLPKTLNEFAEAIDQIKRVVYQQYDDLARQAGDQGARVDLAPVVRDLRALAAKRPVQDAAPEAAAHALRLAEQIAARGTYTTMEAQEFIQVINSGQRAFHAAPNPNLNQTSWVDEVALVRMREVLDDTIEKAAGAGYQGLKNQYGSLTSIERMVNHRGVVFDRRAEKSFYDVLGDMALAAKVVHGLATKSPEGMLVGAAAKGAAKYAKYRNNPNRYIQNLFRDVEKELVAGERTPVLGRLAERMAAQRAAQAPKRRALELRLARGHVPYFSEQQAPPLSALGPQPRRLALPPGQGFEAPGLAPPAVLRTPAEEMGVKAQFARRQRGARAAELADRAKDFPRALVDRMGGPGANGPGPYWDKAPRWLWEESSTTISPNAKPSPPPVESFGGAGAGGLARTGKVRMVPVGVSESFVRREVRAVLRAGTPEWIVNEYVDAAMGRKSMAQVVEAAKRGGPAKKGTP